MTEDDDRGYLIQASICQAGSLVTMAVHTEDNSYEFNDDQNCSSVSGGKLYTVEKHGYTDPVATHPDLKGRGLARALLSEGMRRLRNHGLEQARLSTSSDNLAMQRAAEAVGFRIEDESYRYGKHLGGLESGGYYVDTDQ
jgi:ribosomal protein S18 acetylase RimI-like enzyme